MSLVTSTTLRRASSYDAYTSLLEEIHGRIKLGMGATYATSRAKQQKEAKKLDRQEPTPETMRPLEEESDSDNGSGSEDDLDWEYNDSPTAPEEDVLTFRNDLYYDFMNEPSASSPSTDLLLSTASTSQNDTIASSPLSTRVVDLNQEFHQQLQASTMMVDLHSYYMEYQQRRLREGLAFQDILEFIREHTLQADSEASQEDKNVQELIQKLKDNLALETGSAGVQTDQIAKQAAKNLLGESSTSPSLPRASSYTSSVLKPNPGFLTLKIPDIALAADGLDNLKV